MRQTARQLVARDIRPDSRKRVSIGPALKDLAEASFNVYREPDGRIVLEPQISVPASEVWLFRNKRALKSVKRGIEQAAAGESKARGSFAKYADDHDP